METPTLYGEMDPEAMEAMNVVSAVDPASAAGLTALWGILIFVWLIPFIAIYVYMALALMKLAHKTNTENAWFAWVPFLNIVLMVQIARKPIWWFIMFFIPVVNIVFAILVWMEIAKNVGKPEWWGILMLIPFVNLIVPGYLAFSSSEVAVAGGQATTPAAGVAPNAPQAASPVQDQQPQQGEEKNESGTDQ